MERPASTLSVEGWVRPDCHLHLANKCKFSFFETGKQQKKPGLNENRIAALQPHSGLPVLIWTQNRQEQYFYGLELEFV